MVSRFVDQVEPLIAEIFGYKTGAAVHEIAPESHFLHNVDLTFELFFFKFTVPAPERFAAVFGTGGFKQLY